MKRLRNAAIFCLLSCLTLLPEAGRAIDITVTGNWSLAIDAGDLIAGAGSDLTSTYDSSPNQVLAAITNSTGLWRVDVRRTDTAWHADFRLWVRRTGNGSGSGGISGGTAYLQVPTTTSTFFTGWRTRTDIPVQLRLSGVSVRVPPGTYSTTVTYTVTGR